jgi:hypothetical protein
MCSKVISIGVEVLSECAQVALFGLGAMAMVGAVYWMR